MKQAYSSIEVDEVCLATIANLEYSLGKSSVFQNNEGYRLRGLGNYNVDTSET